MLEITSPGTLMPSFDLNDMSNNPSEIRNKILAPIFKTCNLIEKWGSGFKKILEQMRNYPELELKILEPSNATQIQFIKKDFVGEKARTSEKTGKVSEKTEKVSEYSRKTSEKIVSLIQNNANLTIGEMSDLIGVSTRTIERNINKLQQQKQIKRIGSDRKGYWEVLFDTDIKKN
ncbi:DeoR family transcriptional regulator [bacterium]|nr:DeoR family transcriptional regulator [bacterium]